MANFINASSKKEVTRTLYDIPFGTFPSNTYFTQRNMRGRVSSIQYFETLSSGANATGTYNQAVHYTYDIHGNVDVLLREIPALSGISQSYKTTHYDYDLVSGKVNQVIYQKKHADQFAHKYSYDGDNRIINTYTSTNMVHWDKEAHYIYYLHGPLKRTELGELKVQGVDYAYTLHGWLKGVNSTTLQEDRDIGQDGNGGSINQFVAKDVFGFSLGYYEGDHTPIGMNRTLNPLTIAQQFTPSTVGTTLGNASPNLYNGNIRHMVTAILPFMNAFNPQARAYNYDQLNRIKDAYTYNQVNLGSNIWSTTAPAVSDYEEHFSYDPNGNIMTLQRNGTTVGGGALLMDNFTYNYTSGKNQLTHVDDVVPLANYGDDIDDQLSGNYSYDEIGNLISDQAEQIQEIKWTVYGKIKSIIRSSGSAKPNLAYEYSPDGHRVYKKVTQPNGNIKETYYIRDAQGNTMSTYTFDTDTFRWSEAHIYGSSRIGVYNADKVLVVGTTTQNSHLQANEHENIRGKRHYELSNHLGNVLAVVSDRRTGICTGNGLVAYNAEVVSATDYYAFGSPMPGRQGIQQCSTVTNTVTVTNYAAQEDFSSSSVGGFVAGSGSRTVSNPTGDVLRIGSTWTTRPQASKSVTVLASTNYTLNFDLDSFSFMFGYSHTVRVTVILPGGGSFNTDYNNTGNKTINFTSTVAGNATIRFSSIINGSGVYSPNPFIDIDNFSVYNITTTTTTSTVCSVWDKGYRYGFNSMEKDNEINVNGGSYDFGARIYDSRLGRWLSLDPLMVKYPGLNPYCGMGNNPILYIDIDGKDIKPGKGWDKSIYSEIFNLLSQQNNPIIVNINEYFAGDKPLNITLAYHGNSQGFDLKKHAKFNEKYNDVNGWCGFLSKSPISVSLIMNSNYRPINTVLKTTNNVTDEMNKQYGTGHYCKISQNNIGKTTALIHELVHASMHAQGVDVNSQHGTMARKGTSAANLIYRSLSAANDANNWGLKKDQLLDISYMGLSQTKGFQDYISEKAGIINPNWQDDIKSNDPKKQEEYTKNIELYKNAYKNWKKSVEDITTDKTYYNKDGDVVDYKNIDKKD